jgi:hypothetical protein
MNPYEGLKKGYCFTLRMIFCENITLGLLKAIIIMVHYTRIIKKNHMTLLQ